jgi:hypothetical protein
MITNPEALRCSTRRDLGDAPHVLLPRLEMVLGQASADGFTRETVMVTKSPGGTGVEGDKEVMRRKPDF